MAGDWIKVQKATLAKPEILAMSEILGVHPVHAFGLCVKFWMWCDDQLSDGNAKSVTKVTLDYVIGHEGMTNALLKVGWLRDRSGSLEVPHFDRHLSECSKNRALTKERVTKAKSKRAAKGNANTVTTVTHEPLLEKRREENIDNTHTVARLRVDRCAVEEAIEYAAKCVMPPISEECARCWHDTVTAAGWEFKGFPIAEWKASLRRYASAWNQNQQAHRQSQKPSPHKGITESIPLKKL